MFFFPSSGSFFIQGHLNHSDGSGRQSSMGAAEETAAPGQEQPGWAEGAPRQPGPQLNAKQNDDNNRKEKDVKILAVYEKSHIDLGSG